MEVLEGVLLALGVFIGCAVFACAVAYVIIYIMFSIIGVD